MPWKAWLEWLVIKLQSVLWGRIEPESLDQGKKDIDSISADEMSAPPPSHSSLTHESNLTILFILSHPWHKRPAIPIEIILQILSHPSRWIQLAQLSLGSQISVSSQEACKAVLCTPPLTAKLIRQMGHVVLTFTAKDQGWSSFIADQGTYENSWTWFEIAVRSGRGTDLALEENQNILEADHEGKRKGEERQGPEKESTQWDDETNVRRQHLTANRHASRRAEAYRFELQVGEGILQDLKEGDEIALLACARFSGWTNHVEEAGMSIWGLDDFQEMMETFDERENGAGADGI